MILVCYVISQYNVTKGSDISLPSSVVTGAVVVEI